MILINIRKYLIYIKCNNYKMGDSIQSPNFIIKALIIRIINNLKQFI